MNNPSIVYLGIKGSVVALDRATGKTIWQTKLKGAGFVNVFFDGEALFAHTGGHLFCLEPAGGVVVWENELAGLGYGLATFASPRVAGPNQTVIAAAQQQAEDAERARQANAATPH